MNLLKLETDRLPQIAAAAREKSKTEGGLTPEEIVNAINQINSRHIQAGTIKMEQSSRSVTVPAVGNMIHMIAMDAPLEVGCITQVSWLEMPREGQRAQIAVAARYTDVNATPAVETQSGILASYTAGGSDITFDTTNEERVFAAGTTYAWICATWESEHVAAVYDVSATENDDVNLVLLKDGRSEYSARLVGHGSTKSFGSNEEKPWAQYIDKISSIFVGKNVRSIGENLFRRHEAVKSLIFEDSKNIQHLGQKAFQGCQFGGEFSFPNLQDSIASGTFSHCVKLRGLTLSENIKNIAATAFSSCLNLSYVRGLFGVTDVGCGAFYGTPKLKETDLDPDTCKVLEESAFRVSGGMRFSSQEDWPSTELRQDAIPSTNYSKSVLNGIRAIPLPNVAPRTLHPDGQHQYSDILYCKRNGQPIYISADGCMALAAYHLYNWYHDGAFDNFRDFWNEKLISKNPGLVEMSINDVQDAMAETLGWTARAGFPMYIKGNPQQAKKAIADELRAGRALIADYSIFVESGTDATLRGHAVAIVGADAVTDKLIVVDSMRTSGVKGVIYEVAFEQLFSGFDNEKIISYDIGGAGQ